MNNLRKTQLTGRREAHSAGQNMSARGNPSLAPVAGCFAVDRPERRANCAGSPVPARAGSHRSARPVRYAHCPSSGEKASHGARFAA